MPRLKNQRHERFAQNIAKGMSATQAYIQAGYKARGNSAEVNASRLLRNAQVHERIAELAKRAEREAIADAQEIQAFFTEVMRGRAAKDGSNLTDDHVTKVGDVVPFRVAYRERIRAAELLARARGVFTPGGADSDTGMSELEKVAGALGMVEDD